MVGSRAPKTIESVRVRTSRRSDESDSFRNIHNYLLDNYFFEIYWLFLCIILMQNEYFWHRWYGWFFSDFCYIAEYWNCDGIIGKLLLQFILCLGKTTDEIVIDYLKTKSPVHPDVEGRIKYLIKTRSGTIVSTDPGASSDADSAGGSTSFNVKRVLKASTYSYWD